MAIQIRRKLFFTAIAFLILVVLPILALETFLVLAGWQPPRETDDPFVGISGSQTLFQKTNDGQHLEIKPSRLGYFRPAQFQAEKPGDGLRVFVIGGSTVQGRPWETETSFAKWLELCLKCNTPNRSVEVINCGGVSYASYRLSFIVDEVMEYSPDLVIVCTGHNEFLEDRTYASSKNLSPIVRGAHQLFSGFKSYQWARSLMLRGHRAKKPKATLEEKLVTKLDYENGLALFDESNLQREKVCQHFRFNIEKMMSTVTRHNVPILVLAPPSNQKDCFPFKPSDEWSVDSRSPFSRMKLIELETLDENRADFFYARGLQRLESGEVENARTDFDRAIDGDICPLRMTTPLRKELEAAVHAASKKIENGLLLYLDLQSEFQKVSPQGLIGDELLVDHVHPTIAAHQLIAKAIVNELRDHGIIKLTNGWSARYEQSKTDHQQSLDFGYFQRGRDRLESVKKWARGKANNPLKH